MFSKLRKGANMTSMQEREYIKTRDSYYRLNCDLKAQLRGDSSVIVNDEIEKVHDLFTEITEYNNSLINKYPFLQLSEYETDNFVTWLDYMPDGWRIAFGLEMCEAIKKVIEGKKIKDYHILEIKEKYGALRWYDNKGDKDIDIIIAHYEKYSEETCIVCGEPAEYLSKGWISPYCEKCKEERSEKYRMSFEKINC